MPLRVTPAAYALSVTAPAHASHGHEVRDRLLQVARSHSELLGLMTFGSAARGDADVGSDIDVLVVRSDDISGREVHRLFDEAFQPKPSRLSALVRSATQLRAEVRDRPSFGAHLLDEGRVEYEATGWSGFALILKDIRLEPKELDREVRERIAELEVLRRTSRFRGAYVSYLANIYTLGRSIVIVKLLSSGHHEYGWKRIFEEYERVRPELSNELRTLAELRPFFDRLIARTSHDPPAADEAWARAALRAVEAIAAG